MYKNINIITYEDILEYKNLNSSLYMQEENQIYFHKINNEHDKVFKDLFSQVEEARKFINKFLKLEIPIEENTLEQYNSSYITNEYKSKEADIVYKIKDKNVFFLIEHQSTVDITMPYRILNYSMEIMKTAIDKTKIKTINYKYPLVIPIVLYTGNKNWKANKNFEEKIEELPRI